MYGHLEITNMQFGFKVKKFKYYLQDLYVGIATDVKNQQLFTKPICGQCTFEMALWKLEQKACKYCMFGFMTMPIS